MTNTLQHAYAANLLVLGIGFFFSIFALFRQKQSQVGVPNIPHRYLRAKLIVTALFATLITVGVANSVVVLNGTTSLPHHGYYMLRMPLILRAGNYVSFNTPPILKHKFPGISFVKRIAGVPGDKVVTVGNTVCVNDECRELQSELVAAGFVPSESRTLEQDQYLVFGDAADSLDSRYQVIGPISRSEIIASGWPIPIWHWKEVTKWFNG